MPSLKPRDVVVVLPSPKRYAYRQDYIGWLPHVFFFTTSHKNKLQQADLRLMADTTPSQSPLSRPNKLQRKELDPKSMPQWSSATSSGVAGTDDEKSYMKSSNGAGK
ncbi:hypothetical protein B296_00005545 [Ensete ventricosum]|uniref:Uncharacterized protein n=1 Tax=Ensete ventricosum TaxID=4639 RepID=A0A426ZGE3_ENSVE|nr:hypothetical protein B296_00005545 [Ensete ventricosum]